MLNIVVPMAGRGSRFATAGYRDPKPLIQVHDVPMIRLVIQNLRPQEQHKFIFICQAAHIEEYGLHEKLAEWAPACEVIGIDGITEGAACTVMLAQNLIDNSDPLMIANSDQYVNCSIDDYLSKMADLDGLIMTMTADDPKWSFVGFDENARVARVVEKQVISTEATVGIYNFKSGAEFVAGAKAMIDAQDRVNGEYYVAPVYNYLIRSGAEIGIYNIGSEADGMYGLGIPDDLNLFLDHPISAVAKLPA